MHISEGIMVTGDPIGTSKRDEKGKWFHQMMSDGMGGHWGSLHPNGLFIDHCMTCGSPTVVSEICGGKERHRCTNCDRTAELTESAKREMNVER
jgi:hypothetical protein